ncbi:hypothetical protein CYMTET_17938 [Cymbomonas tetramitiformis]|uniref:Uncharacterized protein n=1 Tax=Cymbomonas tetramitiformis TaxID=36881 RepID=A0AAE0G994_9CHLO|nr:hypothetical protein CYMTET_17938 [Cymbomonas tetramitiformis]
MRIRAELPTIHGDLASSLESTVDAPTVFLFGTIVASLSVSAIPLLVNSPVFQVRKSSEEATDKQNVADVEFNFDGGPFAVDGADSDRLKWSLMGIMSCIPYLNETAWILGALYGEEPTLYAYAVLYTLPYLHCGLQPDSLAFASVLACACQVQIERRVAEVGRISLIELLREGRVGRDSVRNVEMPAETRSSESLEDISDILAQWIATCRSFLGGLPIFIKRVQSRVSELEIEEKSRAELEALRVTREKDQEELQAWDNSLEQVEESKGGKGSPPD